jgi:hypothetical protein
LATTDKPAVVRTRVPALPDGVTYVVVHHGIGSDGTGGMFLRGWEFTPDLSFMRDNTDEERQEFFDRLERMGAIQRIGKLEHLSGNYTLPRARVSFKAPTPMGDKAASGAQILNDKGEPIKTEVHESTISQMTMRPGEQPQIAEPNPGVVS